MLGINIRVDADLSKIAQELNKTVEQVQRGAVSSMYGAILQGNPVDTGFSRANWNVSVGTPDLTVHGQREEKGSYAPLAPAIPENPELLPIYIANGVDYVVYLEEGSSEQAPNGFIRVAVERVKGELETAHLGG